MRNMLLTSPYDQSGGLIMLHKGYDVILTKQKRHDLSLYKYLLLGYIYIPTYPKE